MSLAVAFHRAASREFVEATAWHESKRLGLGVAFLAEIGRCVTLASANPLQFALVHADIRRVVAHRFPYSIYFRAERDRIVVLAVFHGSRSPVVWMRRA